MEWINEELAVTLERSLDGWELGSTRSPASQVQSDRHRVRELARRLLVEVDRPDLQIGTQRDATPRWYLHSGPWDREQCERFDAALGKIQPSPLGRLCLLVRHVRRTADLRPSHNPAYPKAPAKFFVMVFDDLFEVGATHSLMVANDNPYHDDIDAGEMERFHSCRHWLYECWEDSIEIVDRIVGQFAVRQPQYRRDSAMTWLKDYREALRALSRMGFRTDEPRIEVACELQSFLDSLAESTRLAGGGPTSDKGVHASKAPLHRLVNGRVFGIVVKALEQRLVDEQHTVAIRSIADDLGVSPKTIHNTPAWRFYMDVRGSWRSSSKADRQAKLKHARQQCRSDVDASDEPFEEE